MTVGDEPGHQVDQKVERAAMARMLNLADVFEFVHDGLDDRPLAQEAVPKANSGCKAAVTFD
jgi:hypothetical protein